MNAILIVIPLNLKSSVDRALRLFVSPGTPDILLIGTASRELLFYDRSKGKVRPLTKLKDGNVSCISWISYATAFSGVHQFILGSDSGSLYLASLNLIAVDSAKKIDFQSKQASCSNSFKMLEVSCSLCQCGSIV